jgi:hypothetical protein
MNILDSHSTDPRSIHPAVDSSTVREGLSLSDVLALIRQDSQDRPQKYLDQVHVPGGGE